MVVTARAGSQVDVYQLRLPVFEGPLEVLLRLIEREQLAISEVSLLAVFDQFMDFIGELADPSPHVIAEFAAVAGRLSLLKSRALLPQPPRPTDETDELDLVRQLEDYRAVRAAADMLGERLHRGAGAYERGDSIRWPDANPPRLVPQPPAALARAMSRWLTRVPARPVVVPPRSIVTLREMISRISTAIDLERRISFDRIRATCTNRQEVAVAFLALLTLLRRRAVVAAQSELFGPITCERDDAGCPVMPLWNDPTRDDAGETDDVRR